MRIEVAIYPSDSQSYPSCPQYYDPHITPANRHYSPLFSSPLFSSPLVLSPLFCVCGADAELNPNQGLRSIALMTASIPIQCIQLAYLFDTQTSSRVTHLVSQSVCLSVLTLLSLTHSSQHYSQQHHHYPLCIHVVQLSPDFYLFHCSILGLWTFHSTRIFLCTKEIK